MFENPYDRLIVALDLPTSEALSLIRKLRGHARWFKLRPNRFWQGDVAQAVLEAGLSLMADLKLYDSRDSLRADMEDIVQRGTHYVTVHADCIQHVRGMGPRILSVGQLTDGTGAGRDARVDGADGVVCSPAVAGTYGQGLNMLVVCPGIRPNWYPDIDNHDRRNTPQYAVFCGADQIVVGRPIYRSPDPVKAVHWIAAEIEAALKMRDAR